MHTPQGSGTFEEGETLDGDVLPGFTLAVSDIFTR
jgi:hypothetical protein